MEECQGESENTKGLHMEKLPMWIVSQCVYMHSTQPNELRCDAAPLTATADWFPVTWTIQKLTYFKVSRWTQKGVDEQLECKKEREHRLKRSERNKWKKD